ncbi:MAG TPA: hypothetical protein VGH24_06195 [Solirubrobacteraceae bacterium]|jgi:phage tail protein X
MSEFTTTRSERTVHQIARRLFDASDPAALEHASDKLLEANPQLADLESLPPGTLVEIPAVKGVGLKADPLTLSDASGVAALHSLRNVLPDLSTAVRDARAQRVSDARDQLREIGAAPVKRMARDDPALGSRLEAAKAEAEIELEEAQALRKDQPKALAQMGESLDGLLELFGG